MDLAPVSITMLESAGTLGSNTLEHGVLIFDTTLEFTSVSCGSESQTLLFVSFCSGTEYNILFPGSVGASKFDL